MGLSGIRLPKHWILVWFGTIHKSDRIIEDDIMLIYATEDALSRRRGGGSEKVPISEESFNNPTLTC